ncbi:hypothetical protein CK203_059506 [Vitis vinifera]|uniref:Uncharacterized protein n=1 Tax=Vitis vinifera TaxID=29760 RepID=A0A438GJ40_VITVI|nr:hypothetical protein CK203_059506 [Vitis vinifera]
MIRPLIAYLSSMRCCWVCRNRVFPTGPLTFRHLLELSKGRTNIFWYLELNI